MTDKKTERSLTEQACKWISSPEGQKKIEEASKKAQELIEYLRGEQLLDPKVLSEPITL